MSLTSLKNSCCACCACCAVTLELKTRTSQLSIDIVDAGIIFLLAADGIAGANSHAAQWPSRQTPSKTPLICLRIDFHPLGG